MLFANDFKESDGDKSSCRRNERVTRLIPLGVLFSAQYMEKVPLVKRQLMSTLIFRLIVVQGFDDSLGRKGVLMLGCRDVVGVLLILFVAF